MKGLDLNQFLKPKPSNNSESFKIPEYDLEKGIERVLEIIQEKLLTQRTPIIVEGLFALNDLIVKEGDVKVYIDTNTHGRLLRRLLRDTERTGKEPSNTLKYFLEVIVPMHEKHIEGTKNNADLIIKNEYNTKEAEAQKTNLYEIQQKLKGEIDLENL